MNKLIILAILALSVAAYDVYEDFEPMNFDASLEEVEYNIFEDDEYAPDFLD